MPTWQDKLFQKTILNTSLYWFLELMLWLPSYWLNYWRSKRNRAIRPKSDNRINKNGRQLKIYSRFSRSWQLGCLVTVGIRLVSLFCSPDDPSIVKWIYIGLKKLTHFYNRTYKTPPWRDHPVKPLYWTP